MVKKNTTDDLIEGIARLDASKPLETQLTELISSVSYDEMPDISKRLADAYARKGLINRDKNLVNAAKVLAWSIELNPNLIGTGREETIEGYERELAQKNLIYLAAQVALYSGDKGDRLRTYAFIDSKVLDLVDFHGRKASELIGNK